MAAAKLKLGQVSLYGSFATLLAGVLISVACLVHARLREESRLSDGVVAVRVR
ncbi:MAG TPA: hypothetical protein VGL91_24375 [Acidobacteriota bacterium]